MTEITGILDALFNEEELFTYIGYAAGLATILTFILQIVKIIETKKVTNLSSYMYTIYSLGLICWFAYGIFIENWIIVIANLITFFFTFAILMLIIYYDAEDKIERARRDEETYVFNRKYFEQVVPVKLAEAKTTEQDASILMIKAANYQSINQHYGQKVSAKLLKTLAKFLEKDLRENDLVARYENNFFVIYLSNTNDKSSELVANRLYNNAQALKVKISKTEDVDVEIYIGACSSQHAADMETMLKKSEDCVKSITSKHKNKIKISE